MGIKFERTDDLDRLFESFAAEPKKKTDQRKTKKQNPNLKKKKQTIETKIVKV